MSPQLRRMRDYFLILATLLFALVGCKASSDGLPDVELPELPKILPVTVTENEDFEIGMQVRVVGEVPNLPPQAFTEPGVILSGPFNNGWIVQFNEVICWVPSSSMTEDVIPPPPPPVSEEEAQVWKAVADFIRNGTIDNTKVLINLVDWLKSDKLLTDISRVDLLRNLNRQIKNVQVIADVIEGKVHPSVIEPTPSDTVFPVPTDDLYVLVVSELSRPEPEVVSRVRVWCIDNTPSHWRVLDDDLSSADLENEASWVKEAYSKFDKGEDELPYVLMSSQTYGYEGTLTSYPEFVDLTRMERN